MLIESAGELSNPSRERRSMRLDSLSGRSYGALEGNHHAYATRTGSSGQFATFHASAARRYCS